MLSALSASAENFLNTLGRIQSRTESAQRRISTGKLVGSAADAPERISTILQLHADVNRNTHIRTNLERVKTETDNAESVLQQAVSMLERAAVLGSEGTGTMQDASSRASIAGEVKGILERLVAVSATTVEGRYIFSGDDDQQAAYTVDSATGTALRMFLQTATREVEEPGGTRIQVARTAQQIFDTRNPDDTTAADNVFAAVNALYAALRDNLPDNLKTALASIKNASNHLNRELGFYGTTQNRVAAALDASQSTGVSLKAELGSQEDSDLAADTLELTQGQTQLQAALSSRAMMPRKSLFDMLG